MNGPTGIEIQVGLTPGQKVIGKLLHAAYLDVIGRAVAQGSTAVIEVDGRRTEEPFYEAHFVACEPGEHTVEMFMQGARAPTPLRARSMAQTCRQRSTMVRSRSCGTRRRMA
ncbi:hypothetical protein [Mycobacterium sp. EPa45]|uniref:hypothetical protein n=1 Tax=Mycobacterium sp. EPa45 TaxID=1545728 RepID=UPI000641EC2B|nr:hypothetical protein [Mycobacterium sp. EPa45]AKK30004.1 hypothetical protein AB431_28745 [Mycobacterium sp. EPa45]